MAVKTQILTKLIADVKTLLGGVSEIKEVKAHGYSKFTKYPAAVVMMESFDNVFDSNQENTETHRFKIWIIIGATQTTMDNIFETVLPKTIDAVKEKLNENWSGGAIDGHRIWYRLDSGITGLSEENKSLEAFSELILTIRLNTNN